MEFLFTYSFELLAAFDLIGDVMMVKGLLGSEHTFWVVLTIFTMISPFYVCYVPLINFQLERDSFSQEHGKGK